MTPRLQESFDIRREQGRELGRAIERRGRHLVRGAGRLIGNSLTLGVGVVAAVGLGLAIRAPRRIAFA